jgi:hypothetical protein
MWATMFAVFLIMHISGSAIDILWIRNETKNKLMIYEKNVEQLNCSCDSKLTNTQTNIYIPIYYLL